MTAKEEKKMNRELNDLKGQLGQLKGLLSSGKNNKIPPKQVGITMNGKKMGAGYKASGGRKAFIDPIPAAMGVKVFNNALSRNGGRKYKGMDTKTEFGRELISTINATSNNSPGDVIASGSVAPQGYPGTRMSQYTSMYEQYRIIYWKMTYIPNVGTGTAGTFSLFVDPDPTDNQPNGITMQQKSLTGGGVIFSCYEPASLEFTPNSGFTVMFTSEGGTTFDLRLTRAGNWYVICDSVTTNGTTYGNLILDWKIEFIKPLLETGKTGSNTARYTTSTGVSNSTPLGSFGTWAATSGSDFSLQQGSTTFFSMNTTAGLNILILCKWTGTAISSIPAISSTDGNGTIAGQVSAYSSDGTIGFQMFELTGLNSGGKQLTFGTITSTAVITFAVTATFCRIASFPSPKGDGLISQLQDEIAALRALILPKIVLMQQSQEKEKEKETVFTDNGDRITVEEEVETKQSPHECVAKLSQRMITCNDGIDSHQLSDSDEDCLLTKAKILSLLEDGNITKAGVIRLMELLDLRGG